MSDAFADLWSSTHPPKSKAPTLSSSSSSTSTKNQNTGQSRSASSKPDVFSLLAASGSNSGASTPRYGSGLGSRPITPSVSRSSVASGVGSARSTPQPPSQTQASNKASGGDAFGDLFASSTSRNGTGNDMTLAAKLAMQSTGGSQRGPGGSSSAASTDHSSGASSAWAGLDALAGGLTATAAPLHGGGGGGGARVGSNPRTKGGVVVDDVDDWGLGDFGSSAISSHAVTAAPPRIETNTNTNNDTIRPKPKAKTGSTLWDLDDFASGTSSQPAPSISSSHSASSHPAGARSAHKSKLTSPDEDFDFGGREDRVDEERWEHRQHRHHGGGSVVGQTSKLLDLFGDDEELGQGPPSAQGLLGGGGHSHEHEEDDVLGLLSKPVEVVKAQHTPPEPPLPPRPRPEPTSISSSYAKPPSPPPHILGQIVEMGFSVQQARAALARTPTGLDVPAAIESLLGGSSDSVAAPSNPPPRAREEPPPPPRVRGAPKGQKERERERLERQRALAGMGEGNSDPHAAASTPSVADLQEQADKLLAQASEIGLSVFSKASAMWGKGKERVVKAYEERAAGGGSAGGGAPFGGVGDVIARGAGKARGGRGGKGADGRDGRPRWMQEVEEHEEYKREKQAGGVFRDDEDHGEVMFEAQEEEVSSLNSRERDGRQASVVVIETHHEEEVDLFSDAPAVPRAQAQGQASSSTPAPPPTRTGLPSRRPIPTRQTTNSSSRSTPQPAPAPIPERALPSASPSALALALKHKTTGTEQFKLGQYADAASAYSAAIQALPKGHLLLVPLYTNRALARIKCGEYKSAEEDCWDALGIVVGFEMEKGMEEFGGIGLGGNKEAGKSLIWSPASLPTSLLPSATSTPQTAWTHPEGRGVDLADGYVKALRRRAEALEGREKWAAAAADWELLAGCAWASEGVRRDAVRGRGRCKGMEGPNGNASAPASTNGSTPSASTAPTPSAAKPKFKPKPRPTLPTAPSGALRALQSQNAQAEADDALKFSLKDGVDSRLAAWRQGREGNIRALLVGLDGVLWDGALEGVRVRGLHELVSAAQVKKGYVRVIGRVHPDKLNASNSTIEQRMLANGVFGTLNEAWIAFQATQK